MDITDRQRRRRIANELLFNIDQDLNNTPNLATNNIDTVSTPLFHPVSNNNPVLIDSSTSTEPTALTRNTPKCFYEIANNNTNL